MIYLSFNLVNDKIDNRLDLFLDGIIQDQVKHFKS